MTRPPVRSRSLRMRAGSTSRPSSRSATRSAAPAVRSRARRSGSHSACHGPAARWWAWSWAPSTTVAAPTTWCAAEHDERGRRRVALVGHGRRAAVAGFVRLAHLVDLGLHEADDVGGDLAGRAGDEDQRAWPARRPGPGWWPRAASGAASPSRSASRCMTATPWSPRGASVPAAPAELHRQPLVRHPVQRGLGLDQADQPRRRRQPERDRHRVLQQRATRLDVVPVAVGQHGRRRRWRGRGRRRSPGWSGGRGASARCR